MDTRRFPAIVALFVPFVLVTSGLTAEHVQLRGRILDSSSGQPVAARLYIQSDAGHWFFAKTAAEDGAAVPYRQRRSAARTADSVEIHTSLSAHPFLADLPPGEYKISVERGKEYLPHVQTLQLKGEPVDIEVKLRRWTDMSALGWYSGETHVHRSLDELPTVMLAENLNVALPLTYWVTRSHTPPTQGDKNSPAVKPQRIQVDPSHIIYPMNTEYEIFSVRGRRHTLGAVFALNHKTVFDRGVPPVRSIAEQVHREGGLIELDKHNWPWSMMLVPIMDVDLYELTNNHIWRTNFYFRKFGEKPPPYMKIEQDENGMTEKGWTDFTFQNYYALLNCGFRIRPTAGTASGVHPVPLGFGRVYVHVGEKFSYDAWMKGLDAGRSFVTTGPMLVVRINDQLPGHSFRRQGPESSRFRISGSVHSEHPLSRIELVWDGIAHELKTPENRQRLAGGYETRIDEEFRAQGEVSSWCAVRCYEKMADGRARFAHTAPFYLDVPDHPIRPRHAEVRYLIERVQAEIERNADVLAENELQEFREALAVYEQIAKTAK